MSETDHKAGFWLLLLFLEIFARIVLNMAIEVSSIDEIRVMAKEGSKHILSSQ